MKETQCNCFKHTRVLVSQKQPFISLVGLWSNGNKNDKDSEWSLFAFPINHSKPQALEIIEASISSRFSWSSCYQWDFRSLVPCLTVPTSRTTSEHDEWRAGSVSVLCYTRVESLLVIDCLNLEFWLQLRLSWHSLCSPGWLGNWHDLKCWDYRH